jgi:hypothetical protein
MSDLPIQFVKDYHKGWLYRLRDIVRFVGLIPAWPMLVLLWLMLDDTDNYLAAEDAVIWCVGFIYVCMAAIMCFIIPLTLLAAWLGSLL